MPKMKKNTTKNTVFVLAVSSGFRDYSDFKRVPIDTVSKDAVPILVRFEDVDSDGFGTGGGSDYVVYMTKSEYQKFIRYWKKETEFFDAEEFEKNAIISIGIAD